MGFFEAIGSFFASLPAELYVFIISMFPIVELRGAIPVGAGMGLPFFWNYILAVLGNMLPIPFILLFIPRILDFLAKFKLFRPIVLWLRKKADKYKGKVLGEGEKDEGVPCEGTENGVECAENRDTPPTVGEIKAEDEICAADAEMSAIIDSKAQIRPMTRGIFIALLLFVAIPLPGTGAWTGSLIASLFNLPKKWSFLAVLLGVLLSGVIMCLASYSVVGLFSIFMPSH